tara:strand:- start:7739 stop:8764 length:1026 start_codon:yes stop_codon:yes gene_type:complete
MTLQSSGSIKASEIANELGYTLGSSTKIGDYRLNGGQDFGGVKLPVSENVPTSGEIKFSDFYEARRTLVVDYYSANENKPETAKNRFSSRPKIVVGNFVGNTDDTSGKKVVILVNKDIGSDKNSGNSCALRTGTGWSSDTVLEVLVGPDGEVLGAGGNGGIGRNSNSGTNGGFGTSAIGIQHEGTGGTRVTVQSGGRVAAGGGGGGGGGGARVTQERWIGSGSTRRATGGSGGGGAGLPAGSGGGATKLNAGNATVGTNSGANPGAHGGVGGIGGFPAQGGNAGSNGFTSGGEQENPVGYGGGAGGSAGAAIRRNPGFTVVIQNLGPPSQLLGTTSATGIT